MMKKGCYLSYLISVSSVNGLPEDHFELIKDVLKIHFGDNFSSVKNIFPESPNEKAYVGLCTGLPIIPLDTQSIEELIENIKSRTPSEGVEVKVYELGFTDPARLHDDY